MQNTAQNTADTRPEVTRAAPVAALRRMAGRLASRFALWHRRHRTRRTLATLDDRLLRDVGISPPDAVREARRWFFAP